MSNEIFMPGYDRRAVPGRRCATARCPTCGPSASTPASCSAPTAGGTDRSGPAFVEARAAVTRPARYSNSGWIGACVGA